MQLSHVSSIAIGLCSLLALGNRAQAQSVLVLNGTGTSSVSGPLAAAGFNVVSGTLDPGQISSALAAHSDIVEIWIWNDGTYGNFGSPVDPARDFDANDLADLAAFSAVHPHWIMDSLAWRAHLTSFDVDLSTNEALDLATYGGGVVLGTDDAGGDALLQHVNQVCGYMGFAPFAGDFVTSNLDQYAVGALLNYPAVIDPTGLGTSFSYCDVPHGLQPNGLALSTALYGAPSTDFPGFTNPPLSTEVFYAVLYTDIDHLITTTLPNFGVDAIQAFCFPGQGSVMACPCGNQPAVGGAGCDNSTSTGGAFLTALGAIQISYDALQFTAWGEKPTATSIFLQGTTLSSTGVTFGQGVRCVGGSLKRLYVKTASSGVAVAPGIGDPSVSVRSASLGDALSAGSARYYQTYYRDPVVLGGCASTSTFNVTQALGVIWLP